VNLSETDLEASFRSEAKDWLATTLRDLPAGPDLNDWPARRWFDCQWQRLLYDAGYAGLDWPVEWGGRGLSPVMRMIFLEECERAGAPYGAANYVGTNHAGPTIIARGTAAQ
jgi:alkylation response protein AidB-like acyl-CoA dehydrogenase